METVLKTKHEERIRLVRGAWCAMEKEPSAEHEERFFAALRMTTGKEEDTEVSVAHEERSLDSLNLFLCALNRARLARDDNAKREDGGLKPAATNP
jgi:hypothetical protein